MALRGNVLEAGRDVHNEEKNKPDEWLVIATRSHTTVAACRESSAWRTGLEAGVSSLPTSSNHHFLRFEYLFAMAARYVDVSVSSRREISERRYESSNETATSLIGILQVLEGVWS